MSEGIQRYLTVAEREKLGRLVLQSRYVVEGTLAGRHRSPVKGASSEFAEHRSYIAGDDPKHIDWKVVGRTERYFVRQYQDETILRTYLVIDRSRSMAFGGGDITKYEYACRLAAALGYVVIRVRDAVGLFLYAEKMDVVMPPRNSLVHLNNLLKQVGMHEPSSKTRTAETLHRIADSIHRRAMVILFSDLFDDEEGVTRALAHFRKKGHDVILFHIVDPRELDLNFPKGGRFVDMETGEVVVTDPRGLAEEYKRVFGEFLDGYRRRCMELNVDYRLVRTDHDMGDLARAYLQERRRLSR
jgi:uncharacterized protein (DUF58 family)